MSSTLLFVTSQTFLKTRPYILVLFWQNFTMEETQHAVAYTDIRRQAVGGTGDSSVLGLAVYGLTPPGHMSKCPWQLPAVQGWVRNGLQRENICQICVGHDLLRWTGLTEIVTFLLFFICFSNRGLWVHNVQKQNVNVSLINHVLEWIFMF